MAHSRRPFFKASLNELKRIVSERSDDLLELRRVLTELENRRTQAAATFRADLNARIKRLEQGQSTTSGRSRQERRSPATRRVDQYQGRLFDSDDRTGGSRQNTGARASDKGEEAGSGAGPHPSQPRGDWKRPETFELVEPVGAAGKPSKHTPKRDKSVELDLPESAPLPRVFIKVLDLHVGELERGGAGAVTLMLEGGARKDLGTEVVGYVFPFAGDIELIEGATVQVTVTGRRVDGQIVAIGGGHLLLGLKEDFGDVVERAVLRVDNTALLKALRDRLTEVDEARRSGFQVEMAERVLGRRDSKAGRAKLDGTLGAADLNVAQRRAAEVALGSEVSFIWGPPGTGKTRTLSVVIRILFDAGRRVLVLSNTNRAIDQVLLALCRDLKKYNREALNDGAALRVGVIAHDELHREFADDVDIDRVVRRKSSALSERKVRLDDKLRAIRHRLRTVEARLERFERLDAAEAEWRKDESELKRLGIEATRLTDEWRRLAGVRAQLENELERRRNANVLRRAFMRAEPAIDSDRSRVVGRQDSIASELEQIELRIGEVRAVLRHAYEAVEALRRDLGGEDRHVLKSLRTDINNQEREITDELAGIEQRLAQIRDEVVRNCKVMAATTTRAFLKPDDFANFDTVVIDEASMVLLPQVYFAAGLAKERCIVCGDFRQLPPIVPTDLAVVWAWLGRDVFDFAGIAETCRRGLEDARVAMLDERYRMDEAICRLIARPFYGGRLRTPPRCPTDSAAPLLPTPFDDRLTIVDTSRAWPFCQQPEGGRSWFNLLDGLAIRNLCLHLHEARVIIGQGDLGVCTPYAAQAKLLQRMLADRGLQDVVSVATVHRFQGDEKRAMIIDLVDSVGRRSRTAGLFLQADDLNDDGAKLLNVAASRAKEHLIVVANLTFLNRALPSGAFLRGILHFMQERGRVLDVDELIRLGPDRYDGDLIRRFVPDADVVIGEVGWYDQRAFEPACRADILAARESILIYSGFVTERRACAWAEVLRAKIRDGAKVRCVTRPPESHGSHNQESAKRGLDALAAADCTLDLRARVHQKVVVVDGRVLWHGSLNPLSHTDVSDELMLRTEGAATCEAVIEMLSIRKARRDGAIDPTASENPCCPNCRSLTVYIVGRHGPFFRCSSCDWSESVDRVQQASLRQANDDLPPQGPPCPECRGPTELRWGRRGPFYGCARFRAGCHGTVNARHVQRRAVAD